MKNILRLTTLVTILLMFLSLSQAADTLNGAGSTFAYPIYSAWAYDYKNKTGIKLNYQSIGSGGGIRQIVNRTVDFGASDNVLTPQELNKYNLFQFPAVVGGVVLVVNIPGIKEGQLKLDSDTLCKIFLGEIKKFNDPKIRGMNQNLNLPDKEITVIHRSDGSGTTAVFTHYLSDACPAWKNKVGYGTSVKWPVGIGSKGNEGVANYVKRISNSIGYVEFAYAKQNKLPYTLLKNKAGNFVSPSFDTFQDAAATADFNAKTHFATWLTNAPGKNSWPISGATFILLAREKKDANIKTVRFFDWAFKNGDAKARELIYVPLPKSLKDKIRAYWKEKGIY